MISRKRCPFLRLGIDTLPFRNTTHLILIGPSCQLSDRCRRHRDRQFDVDEYDSPTNNVNHTKPINCTTSVNHTNGVIPTMV
jgi:hypothetical protein